MKVKTVDWDSIIKRVESGESIYKISGKAIVSEPTIRKYVLKLRPDLKDKIKHNAKLGRILANYKDGQAKIYKQIRHKIQKENICCEECGNNKYIEIHHKEKLNYDKFYQYWKCDNFNNEDNNINFLCNSCHQKLHYRKLGRKHKVNHCSKTGRFTQNAN